jgi:ABC-type glycerol-3-phosphate transport system permease component
VLRVSRFAIMDLRTAPLRKPPKTSVFQPRSLRNHQMQEDGTLMGEVRSISLAASPRGEINSRTHFWTFLLNSGIVAAGSTALGIVLAGLAGFAMSRFRAPFLGSYNQALLIVQMFPLILAIIPLFIFFRQLDMVNNFVPVILVYTVTQLPFSTWMLRSYFDSIPRDLDEAAKVDGCSPLRSFVQIILPLASPGIAAVAIFSFLFSYNEFFISSVFLRDESRMTIPVGIQSFMQQYSADWGSLMASATLAMVPTLILFLFIQKYLISGALAGAVKG